MLATSKVQDELALTFSCVDISDEYLKKEVKSVMKIAKCTVKITYPLQKQ